LVDHSAKKVDVDLPPRGNEASSDFYDNAHSFVDDSALDFTFHSPLQRYGSGNPACRTGKDNTSILPLEWVSGKLKNIAGLPPMPATNATSRFSDRVENYVRYRPGYPSEAVAALQDECHLTPHDVVADIASGTGIWTRLLLENGNKVFAIEPNAEMREAGERVLAEFPRFTSVAGTAEATTLPDSSVDLVTAAQAAHWFNREKSRQEFTRILKPDGWLVLLWNERLTDTTPFLRAYEQLLLTYGTDYAEVRHERTTEAVNEFFDPLPFAERVFANRQEFDYPGLEGRLLSSSYAPGPGHPKHEPMIQELRRIYGEHALNGRVGFDYETRVYFGRLQEP
jgi:ubiquinone/menaquinone biosynthesis C-methylase UbiE